MAILLICGVFILGMLIFFAVNSLIVRRKMMALSDCVQMSIEAVSQLWTYRPQNDVSDLPADILYAMVLQCQHQMRNWMKYRLEAYIPAIQCRREQIEHLGAELPGDLWKSEPLMEWRETRAVCARKRLIGEDVRQHCLIVAKDDALMDHDSVMQAIRKANTIVSDAIEYANHDVTAARCTQKEYESYKQALTRLLSTHRPIEAKWKSTVSNERLACIMMHVAYEAAVYQRYTGVSKKAIEPTS